MGILVDDAWVIKGARFKAIVIGWTAKRVTRAKVKRLRKTWGCMICTPHQIVAMTTLQRTPLNFNSFRQMLNKTEADDYSHNSFILLCVVFGLIPRMSAIVPWLRGVFILADEVLPPFTRQQQHMKMIVPSVCCG